MGRLAIELTVTAEHRMLLGSIARSRSLPTVVPRRARMVLRLADGERNSAVAHCCRVSPRPAVSLWRERSAGTLSVGTPAAEITLVQS